MTSDYYYFFERSHAGQIDGKERRRRHSSASTVAARQEQAFGAGCIPKFNSVADWGNGIPGYRHLAPPTFGLP
jgi:hypothetical protein